MAKKRKIASEILQWRKRQPPEKIMRRETFEKIKESAKKRYGIGEERAAKVAGAAYWKTVKAKYRGRKRSKSSHNPHNRGIRSQQIIKVKVKKPNVKILNR